MKVPLEKEDADPVEMIQKFLELFVILEMDKIFYMSLASTTSKLTLKNKKGLEE